jgi:hypothetical protein
MSLAALQTLFQQGVLEETDKVLTEILPSPRLGSAARFAVYQHAYRARLAEFLSNDYPVLRAVLGDEAFGELAAAYIHATPSPYRNARWYGATLPDFMRQQEPWNAARALSDLAAFEHALADAFDAPDSRVIDAPALAQFDPQDQPRLRFTFVASLQRLTLLEGVVAAHEAVIEETEVAMPDGEGEETVLIWRDASLDPLYRILGADEALALSVARDGARLDEICALLALRHPAEAAAAQAGICIARWFADGLVSALSCD